MNSELRSSAESKWKKILVDHETWHNLVIEHWNAPAFLENWFGTNNAKEGK